MGEPGRVQGFCSPAAKTIEIQYIQSLLPSREIALEVTDYYYKNMLYWMGGLYHGPTFRQKLLQAYGCCDTLDLQSLDFKWTALLCKYIRSPTAELLDRGWRMARTFLDEYHSHMKRLLRLSLTKICIVSCFTERLLFGC